MSGDDWSDAQNDVIVADYFAMLADELSGRSFNKAAHNRNLQERLGRSRGSIEFKYANISAALQAFEQPIITGYKPRFNFQMSLAEAVHRWLAANPEWVERLPRQGSNAFAYASDQLFIDTAPTLRNAPPSEETELSNAIARRFNVAAMVERNRALGKAGEERALAHEKAVLRAAGREDLASRIVWTSQEEGDGAGYDIASFTADGRPRLLEVKTTNGQDRAPFYISQNELDVADGNRSEWVLFRLYNFAREPRAFEIRPPLSVHVALTATSFRASFH